VSNLIPACNNMCKGMTCLKWFQVGELSCRELSVSMHCACDGCCNVDPPPPPTPPALPPPPSAPPDFPHYLIIRETFGFGTTLLALALLVSVGLVVAAGRFLWRRRLSVTKVMATRSLRTHNSETELSSLAGVGLDSSTSPGPPTRRAERSKRSSTRKVAHRKGKGTPLSTQDGDHSMLEAQARAWHAAIKEPDAASTDADDSSDPYGATNDTVLKLEHLIEAFAGTLKIAETFGPLFSVAIKNDGANLEKVRDSWAKFAASEGAQNIRSLRDLLEAERRSGMHQPGGVLADPSAAIAMVWLRRSLTFQNSTMEGMVGDRSATVSTLAREAYRTHLETFHNFWLKQTFRAGLAAMPKREDFVIRLAPHLHNETEREQVVYQEMAELVEVQNHVVAVMNGLFAELDMEDLRKA